MKNTLQHMGTISRMRLPAASVALAVAAALLLAAMATQSAEAQITTLASFDGTNGANPQAPLVQATNGYLYGTTLNGGTSTFGTDGTIFKITPSGTLTSVYSFCLQSG
ncbi:MAG: choice-of-anchor tandem repeat GloVer-containing protein, partial [Bryobacteraceae bacterium]